MHFFLRISYAVKFTVYDAATGKSLQSTSVKAGGDAETKELLLGRGDYFSVQSTNAKKGGSASYSVGPNVVKTVFFDKGDPSDDRMEGAVEVQVDEMSRGEVLTDDWVGLGDEIDFRKFTLDSGAKLNFTVSASDAAKFTLYQFDAAKGKLKSLQNVSVKAGQTLDTKDLWLEKGEYYYSMQSTNAKKGGNADYAVVLNENSRFFTEGDNTNDTWQAVSDTIPTMEGEEITGWVGFGDASDFVKFAVEEDGRIQLNLDEDTKNALASKQIKLTCLDGNGKSVAIAVDKNDPYTVLSKKDVIAGDYYLGVTCANVKKYDTTYSITTGQLA